MSEEVSKLELAGRVLSDSNTNSYSKYYNDNFEKNGSPSGYKLEKIFEDPQANIKDIFYLTKYYYAKVGIIMRVINIIRDFGTTKFRLNYPRKDDRVKKVIDDYNKRIKLNQLLKDIIFELSQTGNCAMYDRNGKRVDIYPITRVEVSDLIYKNKPVLLYLNNDYMNSFKDFNMSKEIQKKLELSYPKEVARGIKKNEEKILLDVDNTYFIKVNSSRYEKYGMPFTLTAFDDLAHKNVLKEAESATATGIIEKILKIGVGDKDHSPQQKEIDFYSTLFDGKKGSLKVTVPYFVNLEWIEPDTTIFGKEKFEQVDQDILNALGISLTLIRGEGGGNYSEGFLSITGLIQTISNLRSDIPDVIQELYANELVRNGLNPEHAPTFEFEQVEIDKSAKMELVQWMFQNAGLPYEVVYKEAGYDYLAVKTIRDTENTEETEETFKLRQQPFQGAGGGVNNPDEDPKGGRPKSKLSERKTDKSSSNNKTPRPSNSK